MENILYVGGFILPDKNAAAQRVVAMAKGFRALGHQVYFLNYNDQIKGKGWTEYCGFSCFDVPKRGLYGALTNIDDAKYIIEEKKITSVVAYNYPAVALSKLIRWCRKKAIKCYADATEWYVPQGRLLFRLVKTIDTEWRMRILHKRMDGVVAISDYLYKYYSERVPTVKIPPTVDMSDAKRAVQPRASQQDQTVFAYAGTPSRQKERLDLILDAAEELQKQYALTVRIIGITEEQYEKMYEKKAPAGCAEFLGRIPHAEVIREVKSANWSIIIRDNNKVVKAGFPTKVVESIGCGTPVIANPFSNIVEYLDESNSMMCEPDGISAAMKRACTERRSVDSSLFDYQRYTHEQKWLLEKSSKAV